MHMPHTSWRLWSNFGRVCRLVAIKDPASKPRSKGTLTSSTVARRMSASASGHMPCSLLIVDFDDTLTAGDTISVIFNTAVAAAEASAGACGKEEAQETCRGLAENYAASYHSFMEREKSQVDCAPRQAWLQNFLRSLSEFDRDMVTVVEKSAILKGITREALLKAGKQIPFQAGSKRVLERAVQQGISVHVLSVNWSSTMIGAALGDLAHRKAEGVAPSTTAGGQQIQVHANEVEFGQDGLSTGRVKRSIVCSDDKTLQFKLLVQQHAAEGLTVYCGDSLSDLGALLAADVGIVLGSSNSLKEIAAAAGISIGPLREGALSRSSTGDRMLYSAASWAEVEKVLFGSVKPSADPQTNNVPSVLTIAGSDSGGGAGIQADLKTLSALGVFGTSAISALTAQNTQGVAGIQSISPEFVRLQMDAVLDDISIDVVKTGMLPSREVVEEVAAGLRRRSGLQLVVDPVLVATSGDNLATSDVGSAIVDKLFPLATIVTPNLPEASGLLGGMRVDDLHSMQDAARQLHALGPKYVLVKGGHLQSMEAHGTSDDKADGEDCLADVLFDGKHMEILSGPRIRTSNTHGTGCTTASAIAGCMARGMAVPAAVRAARGYVTQALQRSAHLTIGGGPQRPFNHSFAVDDWSRPGSSNALDLRLYAVTDPSCNRAHGRTNAEAVEAALQGGVTFLQLREKDAEGGHFCAEAAAVIAVARQHNVQVVINDRVDVALATGADGVHVGQDDIPAATARQLLGPGKILGVSVKTVEQARQAQVDGADYLGAGAVFPTATKISSTISLDTLAEICHAVHIPVVAIGGITAENAAAAIEAGCAGVAVVSAIFGVEDPAGAARDLRVCIKKERL